MVKIDFLMFRIIAAVTLNFQNNFGKSVLCFLHPPNQK